MDELEAVEEEAVIPICQRCGAECVERAVSYVQPVQVGNPGRGQQVLQARMQTALVWVCPRCPNRLGHVIRFNPNHDHHNGEFTSGPSSAGAGSDTTAGKTGKGSGKAAKGAGSRGKSKAGSSEKAEGERRLSPRANHEALAALEQRMSEKFPDTHFNFTGGDPQLMEGVSQRLDMLMSKYPEVGKSIAYIGTGKDAPPLYAPKWEADAGTFAKVTAIQGRNPPYQVMSLNPEFFGNPAHAAAKMQEMEQIQWFAPGSAAGGMEYMVTHEFGHTIDFYLQGAGQGMKARASSDVATDIWQFKGINEQAGHQISYYAQKSQEEQFAEAFASLHFSAAKEQVGYTKKLGKFLDKTLPGGSSASWKPMK